VESAVLDGDILKKKKKKKGESEEDVNCSSIPSM